MTAQNTDTRERVKRCIIERLELPIRPQDIDDDAPLFAPAVAGGLELDSLAAIEIVVGLSAEFALQLDEVPMPAFQNVRTLAAYVEAQVAASGAARREAV